jgi:nucleoside-diphosphate-sugar epimerase
MGESDIKGPINLGNPEERTLLDLANIVLEVTNGKSKLEFMELPKDDPKQRCPDITKAKNLLGWEPKVDIKAGIQRTADWISRVL